MVVAGYESLALIHEGRNFRVFELAGYEIREKLYESAHSVACRAFRLSDHLPVILKRLKDEFPPPRELSKYQNEYAIAKLLADRPGLGRVLGLEAVHNILVMVVEDWGAESLKKLLEQRRFALEETLEIAHKVAAALGELHAAQVIHKDVNPGNILYNPSTQEVRLIDFGLSTRLIRLEPEFQGPELIEGTFAYMAPEQTGRMNRPVDFRADHYSLGATLYHLLVGQPPFTTEDTRKLLRCHLYEMPVPPCRASQRVPEPVSSLVMKLLAKAPEDRYQSAVGILADLATCLTGLSAAGRIEPFVLGALDASEELLVPRKLYGREREIQTLLDGFERVRQGGRELVLVSGYSGIGKTSLVREIYKPLTGREGYFISGKFDPLKRAQPYCALIDAFKRLCQQLLSEPTQRLESSREKLQIALGENGQVLLEILPEFEAILGPQPAKSDLPPEERQNRFNRVFEKFVSVFATPEHPLVLFLDDLQWADHASLRLIRLLLCASDITSLYLIGAYRANEVDPTHPLTRALEGIAQDQGQVLRILLTPLALEHVEQFLADALLVPLEGTRPLSDLLHQKSDGNPFLLGELLEALVAESLLTLDRRSGQWRWDLDQIRTRGITDNAAELMVRKIQRLDPDAQAVLRLGACLGNRFDAGHLSMVGQQGAEGLSKALEQAVAAGLLVRAGQDEQSVGYRFSHDRVQQAAYSLIPEGEKLATHCEIGRRLLAALPPADVEARPFLIVNHWNLCASLPWDQADRLRFMTLNLRAGKLSKDASAFQAALDYLRKGLEIHQDHFWEIAHEACIELHLEAAEAAYLNGAYQEMEQYLGVALPRCRNLEERVKALEIRIRSDISRDRYEVALQAALAALASLQVRFPRKVTKGHILLSFLRTRLLLIQTPVEGLHQLTPLTSSSGLAAMRLMVSMGMAAYLVDPHLCALLSIKAVQYSIRHGDSPYSSMAYAAYGIMLCGVLGNFDQGYRFGQLAIRTLDKFKEKRFRGSVIFVFANFIAHWRDPLRSTLDHLREAYHSARENGDIVFAWDAATNTCYHATFAGVQLERLEADCRGYLNVLTRINRKNPQHTLGIYHQVVLNLLGRAASPTRLVGAAYDEEQMLPVHLACNDRVNLFNLYLNKQILCFLFHEMDAAADHGRQVADYREAVIATYSYALSHFYGALTRLFDCETRSLGQRRRAMRQVRSNLGKLRLWARHAPSNYQHKVHLVEAEIARVWGREPAAAKLYSLAIRLARENGFVNEEALASELAGRFHLAWGKPESGKAFLREARYAYLRWGARAKVRDLESRYPECLNEGEAEAWAEPARK